MLLLFINQSINQHQYIYVCSTNYTAIPHGGQIMLNTNLHFYVLDIYSEWTNEQQNLFWNWRCSNSKSIYVSVLQSLSAIWYRIGASSCYFNDIYIFGIKNLKRASLSKLCETQL